MQRGVGVSCAQFVVEEHYAVFDIVQRGVKRCEFLGRGIRPRLRACSHSPERRLFAEVFGC
jgi:hypothetical protein